MTDRERIELLALRAYELNRDKEVAALRARVAKLEAALRYYDGPLSLDGGKRACTALYERARTATQAEGRDPTSGSKSKTCRLNDAAQPAPNAPAERSEPTSKRT